MIDSLKELIPSLNLSFVFGKIWSLKMNETDLVKALSLFDRFSDKDGEWAEDSYKKKLTGGENSLK